MSTLATLTPLQHDAAVLLAWLGAAAVVLLAALVTDAFLRGPELRWRRPKRTEADPFAGFDDDELLGPDTES